jgi:hypothetical protein
LTSTICLIAKTYDGNGHYRIAYSEKLVIATSRHFMVHSVDIINLVAIVLDVGDI